MRDADINNVSDAELLFKLSRGERDAFDILYNKYWKMVFNFAFKRLKDRDIAADVAQDIFVQLWIRGSSSEISDLKAYLYTSTKNGVFNRVGVETKYTGLSGYWETGDFQSEEADSGVLYKEFFDSFQQLVDRLPEQQRVIFNLRFVEDLSSNEIAVKLNLSPKTVRNHIGRALATLKSELLITFLVLLFNSGNR